jgi:micrococcal nuclease
VRGEGGNGSLLAGIWCYACGDRYGRSVAEVFTQQGGQEQPLNAEQLMGGMAYVYPQYIAGCDNGDVMKDAEKMAQAGRQGVWAGSYQRPWEYRKTRR